MAGQKLFILPSYEHAFFSTKVVFNNESFQGPLISEWIRQSIIRFPKDDFIFWIKSLIGPLSILVEAGSTYTVKYIAAHISIKLLRQRDETQTSTKMSRDIVINSFEQPVGFPVPNWKRRPDPPLTPMEGRTCLIEPLNVETHVPDLYDAFAEDAEGRNWTYIYGPFPDFSSSGEWLKRAVNEKGRVHLAVIDRKSGRALGMACYIFEPENGTIEIGIIRYSPALQRTTMATEAMYLMLRRVFDELDYRRCAWECETLNTKSMAAAPRFGFSFEAVARQDSVYKGRNRDTAWFSIIDSEWPEIRSAYEKWLSLENFDDEGNQRQTLSDLMRQISRAN